MVVPWRGRDQHGRPGQSLGLRKNWADSPPAHALASPERGNPRLQQKATARSTPPGAGPPTAPGLIRVDILWITLRRSPAVDYTPAASRSSCPQQESHERRSVAAWLRAPRDRTARTTIQHLAATAAARRDLGRGRDAGRQPEGAQPVQARLDQEPVRPPHRGRAVG